MVVINVIMYIHFDHIAHTGSEYGSTCMVSNTKTLLERRFMLLKPIALDTSKKTPFTTIYLCPSLAEMESTKKYVIPNHYIYITMVSFKLPEALSGSTLQEPR